jgi:hypothetical protein
VRLSLGRPRLRDDADILKGFGFTSLLDLTDLEQLKAEACCKKVRGRMTSIARLGLAEQEQSTLEDNQAL